MPFNMCLANLKSHMAFTFWKINLYTCSLPFCEYLCWWCKPCLNWNIFLPYLKYCKIITTLSMFLFNFFPITVYLTVSWHVAWADWSEFNYQHTIKCRTSRIQQVCVWMFRLLVSKATIKFQFLNNKHWRLNS